MNNVERIVKLLGIPSTDIKDVTHSTSLTHAELVLEDNSVIEISNKTAQLKQNNKVIVSVKLK